MTGLVLHPGHHELHGVTVVVRTAETRSYIGRFDTVDDQGIHLLNVAIHEAGPEPAFDAFVARAVTYGVKADCKHLVIPADTVRSVQPLGEYTRES